APTFIPMDETIVPAVRKAGVGSRRGLRVANNIADTSVGERCGFFCYSVPTPLVSTDPWNRACTPCCKHRGEVRDINSAISAEVGSVAASISAPRREEQRHVRNIDDAVAVE